MMKTVLQVLGVLALLASCRSQGPSSGTGISVTVLLAPSGKGDKSYNDTALDGIANAKKSGINVKLTEIQPPRVADDESALRSAARLRPDLILCVGFLYAEAVNSVAASAPDVRFLVDADGGAYRT